ncbi:DMT family transporter [Parapedobacter sp. 2B3]|uniref:DMT family transporter n=1 Tax=Parapedobacter sp. 2B3 TaxID=3342381 RepID=UPI0035B57BFF
MNTHAKGVAMALFAATLWGVSGTAGQFLFQQRAVGVEWLMAVRMLGAGSLLLLLGIVQKDSHVWSIWHERGDRLRLLVFGIAGMLTVQYTYFAAIKHSNAATATILQFSAPVMIAIYLAARYGKRLNLFGYLAVLSGILGAFLLVTHGRLDTLAISPLALALGIASAVSLALYTLMPGKLLRKYSAVSVIGWGLFIGGVAISFVKPPWHADGVWDVYTRVNVLFVVVFGTLIPFYMYLRAVQIIGGQKASLLTSAEPLSATLIAVLWMGVPFQTVDWLGALLIVATVFLLAVDKRA